MSETVQLIHHQDSPRCIRLNEADNVAVVVNDGGVPAGAQFADGLVTVEAVIVTEGIYDRFVAAMTARVARIKVGSALAPGVDVGPVVSAAQLDQGLRYIALGKQEGARLACGGERVSGATEGYYLAPTLFVDSTADMRTSRSAA